jgi:hypothetical protein
VWTCSGGERLTARPAIAAAAVSPSAECPGDTALTAYVTLRPGADPDATDLRDGLGNAAGPLRPHRLRLSRRRPDERSRQGGREALARIKPETASQTAAAITETEELWPVSGPAHSNASQWPEDDFFALEGDS